MLTVKLNLFLAVAWPPLAVVTLFLGLWFTLKILRQLSQLRHRKEMHRRRNSSTSSPRALISIAGAGLGRGERSSISAMFQRVKQRGRLGLSDFQIGALFTFLSAVLACLALLLRLITAILFSERVLSNRSDRRSETRVVFARGPNTIPYSLAAVAAQLSYITMAVLFFERLRFTMVRTAFRLSDWTVRLFRLKMVLVCLLIPLAIAVSAFNRVIAAVIAAPFAIAFPFLNMWMVYRFYANTLQLSRKMIKMVVLTSNEHVEPEDDDDDEREDDDDEHRDDQKQLANEIQAGAQFRLSSRMSLDSLTNSNVSSETNAISNDTTNQHSSKQSSTTMKMKKSSRRSRKLVSSSLKRTMGNVFSENDHRLSEEHKHSVNSDTDDEEDEATSPYGSTSTVSTLSDRPSLVTDIDCEVVSVAANTHKKSNRTSIGTMLRSSHSVLAHISSEDPSLDRVRELLDTSVRLSVATTTAISTTTITYVFLLCDLAIRNSMIGVCSAICSQIDLCINIFTILLTFSNAREYYDLVFGRLHRYLMDQLQL